MTPEKKTVFTDNNTEKNVRLGKNFNPPSSKRIMVRPIDRQDTAAYSVFLIS